MGRITWAAEQQGVMHGAVGELDLFTILTSDFHLFPKYFLKSRLDFHVADMRMASDDLDVVKDTAERQVAGYVAALGAVFPDA